MPVMLWTASHENATTATQNPAGAIVLSGPMRSAMMGTRTRAGRPAPLIRVVRSEASAYERPKASWLYEAS